MPSAEPQHADSRPQETLLRNFQRVRDASMKLAAPLTPEDCVIQSMPDVSPTRWHLAHTTWFFETFVLRQASKSYETVDPAFEVLFNSYYNSVGSQFPRDKRGLLSRPSVQEVMDYRKVIDDRVDRLLTDERLNPEILDTAFLGLQHEQQHQELMLTDIKHVFSQNPLFPIYVAREMSSTTSAEADAATADGWRRFEEGIYEIGHDANEFCFDNETPRHRVFLEEFEIGRRPVTCGEYLEFIRDKGYSRPELWLSEGWATAQDNQWKAPLYWRRPADSWELFTLSGVAPLRLDDPVCHLSYFEADAFARWAGARLPREEEWELAAEATELTGNFVEDLRFHPTAASPNDGAQDMAKLFGDVWEWTSSPYTAYPGFAAAEGALGEYNGKFMCNQFVLRGGSCVTSHSHIRPTYRNFFPPGARWQFSGLRLAR